MYHTIHEPENKCVNINVYTFVFGAINVYTFVFGASAMIMYSF